MDCDKWKFIDFQQHMQSHGESTSIVPLNKKEGNSVTCLQSHSSFAELKLEFKCSESKVFQ